ncbi:Fe-S metabolism protein SufE [Oleiphilus sp. HI0009]|uniref:SufE family protein n=1 Tax=unclassified Oleiphilus TaxID=2631174 RepID=UPI0007C3B943|nr:MULTISPECIES: SufE family protein [unclassified Oleiphilus]KZX76342.1 Fe-S metabolism protein SufE [Oleiphilus sp. HI0009]MCH2158428.1 SufE family protein [Oleiphilaceae bacterium]KZX82217.1 Fe-S metabolism protein SufE [Oleiphilus sp. HI0009]KZY62095.1 Fe-S metabolism protein SufE [Oleiphilus sp. HI0066]KZY70731.1 Fe-S metabolism protein SufE [Oleiphilus sp. HI0067]
MTSPSLESFKSNPLGSETTIEDIYDAFEFLDDWEERYGYIIDLGKSLPEFPESERTEDNYVHGCQSQVWLIHKFDADTNKLYLMIDSDAIIVKGLAAIVLVTLNAKTPQEIIDLDVEAAFEKIDLMRHISPTRGNGLRAMLELIKKAAAENS